MSKKLRQFHGISDLRDCHRLVIRIGRLIDQPQHHDRQDRADGAQCYQTEAVVCRMMVITDGRNTDTKCHDKRNGHGSRGHTSGIKRHCPEVLRYEKCKNEHYYVEKGQQWRQGHTDQHTQKGNDQEDSNPHCHCQDQRHVRNRRHLCRQHLQVRLGNGDHHSQQKR